MSKVHHEIVYGADKMTEFLNDLRNRTNLSMNVLSITESPGGFFTVFYIDPRD